MLLQAPLQEHFCVVADDIRLAVLVKVSDHSGSLVLNLVSVEKNALAEEVRQDVVCADKLHTPVQGVEDIGLLRHEFVVVERDADVLEQLLDSGVGHLVILG